MMRWFLVFRIYRVEAENEYKAIQAVRNSTKPDDLIEKEFAKPDDGSVPKKPSGWKDNILSQVLFWK